MCILGVQLMYKGKKLGLQQNVWLQLSQLKPLQDVFWHYYNLSQESLFYLTSLTCFCTNVIIIALFHSLKTLDS